MIKYQDGRRTVAAISNRLFATVFLVAVCCFTLIATAKSTYTVNVLADGKTIMVTTSEQNPDVILTQAGISLGQKDKLNKEKFQVGNTAKDGNELVVLRAMPIIIIDDGKEVANITVAGTVADAMAEAGVKCRAVDKMNYTADTELSKNMKIEIQRAFSVDVVADGKTQTIDFLSGTVADVLTKLQISLSEDDEVSPSLNTELSPGKTVHVYRVSYKERTETEVIKYKTITKTSSSIYKGTTKVEQEGKNGEKTVVYKDKIVDGVVSRSTKLSETVNTPATDKIVVKGTKIKVLTTGSAISSISLPSSYPLSDGIPTNAITTITGRSTAYTASAGAKTASGATVKPGYVAVDPNKIPYGTEMYVVSTDGKYVYGYCIAADTGGFIKGSTVIDLFMDTKGECYQWGNREVCIYILKWGNGRV
ncbi:MAG: ubiquitin-like domain-containing protein [Oscillospiraceae bacterium]|nr:ubiquitin-like domain-containing protein [Oscillospiraceae bacterium]